jgi:hypothetical protein
MSVQERAHRNPPNKGRKTRSPPKNKMVTPKWHSIPTDQIQYVDPRRLQLPGIET